MIRNLLMIYEEICKSFLIFFLIFIVPYSVLFFLSVELIESYFYLYMALNVLLSSFMVVLYVKILERFIRYKLSERLFLYFLFVLSLIYVFIQFFRDYNLNHGIVGFRDIFPLNFLFFIWLIWFVCIRIDYKMLFLVAFLCSVERVVNWYVIQRFDFIYILTQMILVISVLLNSFLVLFKIKNKHYENKECRFLDMNPLTILFGSIIIILFFFSF